MKKELLQRNKNIFKGLHELYNFDFEADFTIQKHRGKFTLNTIKKALENVNIDSTNTVVIMVDVKYRENYCYIVQVLNDGFCISFPKRKFWYGLDDFYSKKMFEDYRKDESKIYYIVSQNKELEKIASEKKTDYNGRFKYVSKIGWGDGKGNHGISQIDLLDIAHNGKKITIHTQRPASSTDVNYFIDKSGYMVEGKKEELKRKAQILRREREKASVDIVSFDNEILTFEKELQTIKNTIALLAQNMNNYETACDLDKIIGGIRWLYLSVDRFKESNKNKKFSSVDDAKKRLFNIETEINKLKEIL